MRLAHVLVAAVALALAVPAEATTPPTGAGAAATAPPKDPVVTTSTGQCGAPQIQQGVAALGLSELSYAGPAGHHTLLPVQSAGAAYVFGVGLLATQVAGQCLPRLQLQAAAFASIGLATGTSTPTASFTLTPAALVGFRLTGTWLATIGVGFDAVNAGGRPTGFATPYSSVDNLHFYLGMVCEIPSLTSSTPATQ